MKKTLFLSLIVLAVAVIIILAGRHSPFGKRNTSFASVPKKEITKIVFSGEGKELILENREGKWLLNRSLQTRRSSINYILRVLKELDIKSPVSPEHFDTAVLKTRTAPVRVRTYENKRMLNDFLVYKTGSNIYGNIMKKGKYNKPFIVYVPGHDADIGSAFTMNELYWQPYTIFNLLPSEIISVEMENLADTAQSFSMVKADTGYVVTNRHKPLKGFDAALVKRYLTYFTFIPFESWALGIDGTPAGSVPEGTLLYNMKVKTKSAEQRLSLWQKINPDGTIDSDRMYGKSNSADAVFIVRYFDIDPILKKREYFFQRMPL